MTRRRDLVARTHKPNIHLRDGLWLLYMASGSTTVELNQAAWRHVLRLRAQDTA